MDDGVLDEAFERMHECGPEFRGWLSNHGPMAADALVRLGGAGRVHAWLDDYTVRLDDALPRASPVPRDRWRESLGDHRLLPAWLALMERELADRPWQEVLAVWWPRLLPGVLASATHGVIRTGHAVRALREVDNDVRRDELAHALGYWAARWQPVPQATASASHRRAGVSPDRALASVPAVDADPEDGIRIRLTALATCQQWPAALQAVASAGDPAALVEAIATAALRQFPAHAAGDAVMLVHSVTAPAAISLVLPSLRPDVHAATAEAAWAAAASVTALYRLRTPTPARSQVVPSDEEPDDLARRAVAHGDEHVLKLAEAAFRSQDHRAASAAVGEALTLIEPASPR